MRKIETTTMAASAARLGIAAVGAAIACTFAFAAFFAGTAGAHAELREFVLERSTAQAGGHPDVFVQVKLSTKNTEAQEFAGDPTKEIDPCFCADPKQIAFHFPTGFIGNPHAIPKCTLAQLGLYKCPPDSQVGIATALFGQQFLYNMEPRPGEPGLLASQIPLLGTPVFTILRSRTDSDYGLDATTPDIFHLIGLQQLTLRIWGVPTDPVNDKYRAPLNEEKGCFATYPEPCRTTPVPATAPPTPYLQNPTFCGGQTSAGMDALYYNHELVHGETAWGPTTGCDLLQFNPALVVAPTTDAADTPSGLDIIARVPQTQSPTVPSPSELRRFSLTLPKGMTVNPSAADGKTACTDAQSAIGSLEPAECPESSKVGKVDIDSSALPAPISGAVYLGEPKPGDTYRLILAASGFETNVKLVGEVHLDHESGRIEVVFDELPQSPLQEFDVHMFGAERGLLATPEHCGEYEVQSEFAPWATELGAQSSSTSFTVDRGPNGGPCPGPARPFEPTLVAGTPDNTAGAHSPLGVKLTRKDGDQNMTGLRILTPPGFLASLRGIPYCPESAIAQLSTAAYTGVAELASSACPVASLVGTVTTGVGAGSRPLYTPGKVYLAGPYKGAPVSLVVVVPAVAGPYDLGNVVVRAATYVDPVTTQVTTVSDPLPQILDGVSLRLRTVQVNLDRPDFALNPTNCDPFSLNTTLTGDEGGQATPSAFYQVANCASLGFSPRLSLKLTGGVKRRGHPAIHAVLTAGPGEANIQSVKVTLPVGELLDNTHLGTVCTHVDLVAKSCPAGSLIGNAEVVTPLLDQPLRGPVFLGASQHKLPDIVADLEGQIDIRLAGQVSAVNGAYRASFESLPDAPIETVKLNLAGGSKGLLQNSESLCFGVKRATVRMTGQNGAELATKTKLDTSCSSNSRRRRHKRDHRKAA
jgi:hypothetical protein